MSELVAALERPQWPVFGRSKQREALQQNQLNILDQQVSEIVAHVVAIEAVIADTVANLAYLNANAIVSFTVESTYDSTACPGLPVVDLFEAPTVTPNLPHGQAVVCHARPLLSADDSIIVSHDPVCGYVNLQADWTAVSVASAGGTQTLVSGTGVGPTMLLKGLTAVSGVTLTSDASSVTIAKTAKSYAGFYSSGSVGVTLTAANTPYAVSLAMFISSPSADFGVQSTSQLVYTGSTTKVFMVSLTASISSASANWNCQLFTGYNGISAPAATGLATITSAKGFSVLGTNYLVSLNQNDYLQMAVQTTSAASPVATISNAIVTIVEI